MASKLDNHLAFHHQALSLRAHRQQVLAGNIANADTPNFKARDIDFSAALKNAMAGRDSGIELSLTSARHIPGSGEGGPAPLLYRQNIQPSADGNTVDMDVERSQFAENAIFYEASVSFVNSRLKGLMTAIQGQ
ncbi:MAG: flagellar basal body rod protein FlgB [Rhodocyclaceae bacterium]|nr:flagellar basal body rod protein FlgB [Rhodocyclaceae bacterium]